MRRILAKNEKYRNSARPLKITATNPNYIHKELNHGDTEDTETRTCVIEELIENLTVCFFLLRKHSNAS